MCDRVGPAYRAHTTAPAEIWIVGDGVCPDAQDAAEAAGLRVGQRLSCAECVAALENLPSALILLELSGEMSADEDLLVDVLCAFAGPVVVAAPLAVLDAVASRLADPYVTLLCEPGLIDWIAALTLACWSTSTMVADVNGGSEAMRLQNLSAEVARIAQLLANLVNDSAPRQGSAVSDGLPGYRSSSDDTASAAVSAKDIRTMIRLRRQREAVFGEGLFADPVWDMLLDLAAARLEGVQVSVSSLCIAATVPPTTALRWIASLTAAGTIIRVPDSGDRRRVFLALTDAATAKVLDFLGRVKRAGAALI